MMACEQMRVLVVTMLLMILAAAATAAPLSFKPHHFNSNERHGPSHVIDECEFCVVNLVNLLCAQVN